MKKNNEISGKLIYETPHIKCIEIDNEISLSLESEPPNFEGTNGIHMSKQFFSDPFKIDFC